MLRPVSADSDDVDSLPPGWLLYDGGSLLSPDESLSNAVPVELAVDFLTRGTPAVKWQTSVTPAIPVCTLQADRPSWATADRFRVAVSRAVDIWNATETAIGLDYEGDCSTGGTWSEGNRRNEIAWDDEGEIVVPPQVAVTQGIWTRSERELVEGDILIRPGISIPDACFDSVLAHELGHLLGLGHSDAVGDLMYPSFNSNDPSTCPSGPSAFEIDVLRSLYGANGNPTIVLPAVAAVAAGERSRVSVSANDPDGDALTYTWTQIAGPVAEVTSRSGNSLTFIAPDAVGALLQFQVEVTDHYLHRAVTALTATIIDADVAPSAPPSLGSLALSSSRTNLSLGWSSIPGATEYRFCSTPTGTTTTTCRNQDTPRADVTWDTVLGPAVVGEEKRVLTSGTRLTSMAACNAAGCSVAGVGPHAGGLRWSVHQVSYDYFAMSFDVPGTSIRFTIAGVTNISGPSRKFSLYSGTAGDFTARRILNCGNLAAGKSCLGLLGPGDGGHTPYVTIQSERASTPVIEHRVKVR